MIKTYMKPNIKAAFFDLDGTLLSHTLKRIPESAELAIRKLQENGIKVFLATGRHMIQLYDLPVMHIDYDGFITLNGQLVLDKDKNLISGIEFDDITTSFFVDLFNKKEMPLIFMEEKEIYLNFTNEKVKEVLKSVSTEKLEVKEYTGNKLYMVTNFISPSEDEEFRKLLPENIEIARWGDSGSDLILKGDGKVVGIKQVIDYLNITKEEIIAFGDADNDLSMLDFAGIGVALGNGTKACKDHADYITNHIDEDGVYNALKHFELI